MGWLIWRAFSILPLLVFLYFFPCFSISMCFLIWSIHQALALALDRFPSIFECSIKYPLFSHPHHMSNHLNLLFWISFFISSTPNSNCMSVFLILSFFALLKIILKNFISMAWSLVSSLFVVVQVSAPYVGLDGLGVTFSLRDPRFAGSNLAEVDGFFSGCKNLEHKSSRRNFKLRVPSLRFQAL